MKNYLINTHYLMWFFFDSKKIPPHVLEYFLDTNQVIYYSPVSLWEISLKYSKGKLILNGITPTELYLVIEESRLTCLPISNEVFIGNSVLPNLHLDPFDRILCYQAIRTGNTLITNDTKLNPFQKFRLHIL